MRKLPFLICFVLAACIYASCGDKQGAGQQAETSQRQEIGGGQAFIKDDLSARNIVQIAVASKDHSTLVAAVQAAGMENVLANPGPLTVFAPTNAAFEKLPDGTVENLLKRENKKTLMRIITYHAAPGTYNVKDLKDGMLLGQATGDNVNIKVDGNHILVNDAKILGTVEASNGVVHVIDAVLLPPDK